MNDHEITPSEQFIYRYRQFQSQGWMTLPVRHAMGRALEDIQADPSDHDGRMPRAMHDQPHWVKKCRFEDSGDTGLRVLYLMRDEGGVLLDDLYFNRGM